MTDSFRFLIARVRELDAKATPGPWAWDDTSDKGGDSFVLGTFYDTRKYTQNDANLTFLEGRIESEIYDEAAGQYVRVADYDELICGSDNGRFNKADPAFISEARTLLPALADALEQRMTVTDEMLKTALVTFDSLSGHLLFKDRMRAALSAALGGESEEQK